jgi:hypothetical protein
MQGNFTISTGGVITTGTGSRIISIPVDKAHSRSGFIEWLATNASWPSTIHGLGNSPSISRNPNNPR